MELIMKFDIDVVAYKLWVFLFMPLWWGGILFNNFFDTQNSKSISFLFIVAILLIIANYLTYIRNRVMYWLGYILIFFFSASIMSFLPNFIVFNMKWLAMQFSSYQYITNFAQYFGILFLLSYIYFWSGTGYLFNSYRNIGIKTNINIQFKAPEFIKNPIVIGSLIISLGGVVIVAYYRYTDPHNVCIRETLKEREQKYEALMLAEKNNTLPYCDTNSANWFDSWLGNKCWYKSDPSKPNKEKIIKECLNLANK